MHHTAGATGTSGMLGLQQTGRKLITDLRAILKSLCPLRKWRGKTSALFSVEGKFFFFFFFLMDEAISLHVCICSV